MAWNIHIHEYSVRLLIDWVRDSGVSSHDFCMGIDKLESDYMEFSLMASRHGLGIWEYEARSMSRHRLRTLPCKVERGPQVDGSMADDWECQQMRRRWLDGCLLRSQWWGVVACRRAGGLDGWMAGWCCQGRSWSEGRAMWRI